jgi:hypothetical protein
VLPRHHTTWHWLATLILPVGLSLPIHAKSPADGAAAAFSAEPKPAPYSDGHVWLGTGLAATVVSMTVTPGGSVLVLGADGTVYQRTGERQWMAVLGTQGISLGSDEDIDEEQVLLEAEGFLSDAQDLTLEIEDEESEDSDEEAMDDDPEAESERSIEAPVDSVGEMADMVVADERGDGGELGPQSGRLIWASTGMPGLVLLSRGDGVWRSRDDGLSWERAGGLSGIHSLEDGQRGHILAGTQAGVRLSRDGASSWKAIKDPIARIEVFDFARDGALYFAGTSEGLFRSNDGLHWAKLLSRYDSDVPVWSVAVDPYWDGGLWVTGPVGVLRSDDGGQQLRAASQNSMQGSVSLLALSQPGHILAAGIDGVWESQDGGVRWRPVAHGLPSPANYHLGPGPMVAGVDGAFDLVRADLTSISEVVEPEVTPDGVNMGILVSKALSRSGMRMGEALTQRTIAQALLLPMLTLDGSVDRKSVLSGDYEARSNKGAAYRSWDVGVTACFGACRNGSSYSSYGMSGDEAGMGDVVVIGDEVYGGQDGNSLAPMAANVAERLTRYRTEIANQVSELVLSRRRLVGARSVVQSLSLREQVSHELDVLETTARLDVFTSGYFTRVLEGS